MSSLEEATIILEADSTVPDRPSEDSADGAKPATSRSTTAMRDEYLVEHESILFNSSKALIRFHEGSAYGYRDGNAFCSFATTTPG